MGVSDPQRVVFTSSATHGLNIAIRSLVRPLAEKLLERFEGRRDWAENRKDEGGKT